MGATGGNSAAPEIRTIGTSILRTVFCFPYRSGQKVDSEKLKLQILCVCPTVAFAICGGKEQRPSSTSKYDDHAECYAENRRSQGRRGTFSDELRTLPSTTGRIVTTVSGRGRSADASEGH